MRFLKIVCLVLGLVYILLAIAATAVLPMLGCSFLMLSPIPFALLLFSGAPQRLLENSYFWIVRKRRSVLNHTDESTAISLTLGIVFYVVLALSGFIAGCWWLFTADAADRANPPTWFMLVFLGGTIVALLFYGLAFTIHFLPNSSRRMKYNLVLMGFGLHKGAAFASLSLAKDGAVTDSAVAAQSAIESFAGNAFIFGADILLLFGSLLVAAVLFSPYFHGRRIAPEPGPGMTRFFHIMHRFPVLLPFAFVCVPCLPFLPYLFVRYYLRERFRLAPILYLRSFGQEDAPVMFSASVLREAGKYGVVACVAHDAQKPYVMQERAHPLAYARMTVVQDEIWQQWVEKELTRSRAVVIDVSVSTPGLTWEVARVKDLVPHEKVLTLRNERSEAQDGGDFTELVYSHSRESQLSLRLQLREWLSARLLPSVTAAPRVAAASTPP